MTRLTIQQRTKIIKFGTWSATKVQQRYCKLQKYSTNFGIHPLPGPISLTIKRIVEKFTTVGSRCDQHKGHSGGKANKKIFEKCWNCQNIRCLKCKKISEWERAFTFLSFEFWFRGETRFVWVLNGSSRIGHHSVQLK